MNTSTNEQLIERCRDGQHDAYEVLVNRYQVLVCSVAFSIVGNVSSSEDVAQEAFLQAWKKLSELREPKMFKSWLLTITRNEARGLAKTSSELAARTERACWNTRSDT